MTRNTVRALVLPVVLWGAVPVAPARAEPTHVSTSQDEASLVEAEDAFFAAQIKHDFTAVEASLGKELIYCHANGRRETRAEHLAALRSGNLDYRRIEASDRVVHVYGNVGTTRANLKVQVGTMIRRSSVLAVYVWRDGHWQLVSWQTTPVPDA